MKATQPFTPQATVDQILRNHSIQTNTSRNRYVDRINKLVRTEVNSAYTIALRASGSSVTATKALENAYHQMLHAPLMDLTDDSLRIYFFKLVRRYSLKAHQI